MTDTQSAVQVLTDQDQAIDTAISDRDATVLESHLAGEFIYTHANGRSQPKPEFIATIAQRSDPPRRILSDIHVELHGDVAITRGDLDIRYLDNRPDLFMRYVRIYRWFGSGWHAISHRTVYATDRKREESE